MMACFCCSSSRRLSQVSPGLGRVGEQGVLLDEIDDGLGGGGNHRVSAEGGNREALYGVGNFRRGDGEADGQAVAESLGAGDDVRHNAPMLDAEPLAAGASPGGLDLVADENPAVAAHDFGHDGEVLARRRDEAGDALQRLGDEGRRCVPRW